MSLAEDIRLKELRNGNFMEVSSFIHIAIVLAEMVHEAHKRNTVIGDLNPASILIREETNLAALADNREADYAYLSPEQTGRINHMPDGRSDLYALGMMYYEMLAGCLPFQAQSAEEWVHAHLAIVPKPLRELRQEIAGSLEDIIMKLLAKGPEERYQSAYGLLADLRRCASSMEERGEIVPFEIARIDEASRFRLPRNLFGIETEEEKLREAYERARAGESAFIVVSGRAGSGKTALVRELQVRVTREDCPFITGKCDLMNRDIPLSPILQALRILIRQVWRESPERVARIKTQLTKALGQGKGVIAQLLPEAGKLLGELPSVEPLPPAEAAIRFHRLFPIFIKVFIDRKHPLVMFLDDLQWADSATMDVLRTLAYDGGLHSLLVIGAFREEAAPGGMDNAETQAAAALGMGDLLSLHKADTPLRVQHIALSPLSYIDVRHFVSSILNENSARVRLLAEALYHRTGGNPLYLHRFLDSLYREKKLYFDEKQAIWTWDAAAVTQMPEDPDILQLIESRIRMLSHETIGLLGIAAATGHRFRPELIALVSEYSLPLTRKLLLSVEEEGLIGRVDDADKAEADDLVYTFLHDRVQQAAYMTIPEVEKAALHLKIGRVMQEHAFDQQGSSIFDMVYHLNLGSSELFHEAEKLELAAYNLQAGLKSKATTAFAVALHFLETGLRLTKDDGVGTNSLAYRLMLELPECEYMCGRVDRAEELLDRLMIRTTGLVERSHIYLIRIAMNTYLKNDEAAVNIGWQALAEFGWHLPRKPSKAAVVKEVLMTQSALYRMRNELPRLPLNDEPHYKALSNLVMAIATSVFTLSLELSAVLFSRFVRYGLKHGNNEAFAFILAGYGLVILRNKISFFQTGLHYIDQAFQLSASSVSVDLQCRLHYIRGLAIMLQNPEEGVEHFERAIHYGMESANLTYVSIAMLTCTTTHTGDLYTLSSRITDYEELSQKLVDEVTLNIFRIARWYMAQLQGDDSHNDGVVVPLQSDRFKETLNHEVYYICTCQIEIAYLSGRYQEALQWVEQGKFNTFRQTRMQVRKQHVYQALTLAAIHAEAPPEERKSIRAKLSKQWHAMKQWSGYYGQKSSAYLLITAECHRIDGNRVAAARGYEDATREARRERNGLMEAIACERASTFYREEGSITGADVLMEDACAAYSKWGAAAKVRRLRELYPSLPLLAAERQEDRVLAEEADPDQEAAVYDKTPAIVEDKVLIRQITGWSNTGESPDVRDQFLESVLRYSGAEKGYVISSLEDPHDDASYAETIVRYVIKTGESIVLADASRSSYAADPYIRDNQLQSVLCMPILIPRKLLPSVLYLENNLISGVFTTERLEVLELMITRMVYLQSLEDSHTQTSVSSEPGNDPSTIPAIDAQPLVDPLTNRETETLYALADGLSNKEIAYRFGLTEGTVKSYVFNLYGKLGAKRRVQAIARARELGLLD
ncbi:serine/threonine protein kinase [Paenibacillus baekrokdamisoli]|uniref:Serine/threonine protein kinase n=1 Tax=Paenibacillus baekrokdamisoli TaxID=1712516 RepID=A0A3G9JEM7_9BACL|nr:AAA family ATPase [Paenibacillus baekrokdamisoli]MBB3068491.1 putative ATPase/DNA-binding CsgD family transcriptional regulator [Paenibacillus baekrokdamisoli]BBH22468.1 serine/threonine protein kinase [Paenibacillus baekrokdamisoli]